MPTKRKLINKRAYDEMLLVQRFLELNNRDYRISLELDQDRKEFFVIINNKTNEKCVVGYNYSELMKNLTKYISAVRNE